MRDFEKISIDELRELFAYDPETGDVSWRARDLSTFADERAGASWNAKYAGRRINTVDTEGYAFVARRIDGRKVRIYQHRIAWALHYGAWPVEEIDHISGVKADNRIENLREVAGAANALNRPLYRKNQTGIPGVRWNARRKNWAVSVGRGKAPAFRKEIKCFGEAVRLRRVVEAQVGYHPNHGRVAEGVGR